MEIILLLSSGAFIDYANVANVQTCVQVLIRQIQFLEAQSSFLRMSLSKQTFDVVSFYNECLASSPILTKALTSGIIGFTGAYVSSKIRVFIPTCNLCYKQQYNNAFIFLQNSKSENL